MTAPDAPAPDARDPDAVLAQIAGALEGLSPQLRRAARHLLDHPDRVAVVSMRRLADEAGVVPASFVRLAERLGFAGFTDLAAVFRARLVAAGAGGYADRARRLHRIAAPGRPAALIADYLAADRANLDHSLGDDKVPALMAAAAALAGARRVVVVGQRKCHVLGFYLAYALDLVRPGVVLAGDAAGLLPDALRGLGAGDVLVAVTIARYARSTRDAAVFAAGAGATVIAITDSPDAPVAAYAGHVLTMGHDGPGVFRSLTGGLALCQALVGLVAVAGGAAADDRVAAAEAHLDGFRTFVDGGAQWPAGRRRMRRNDRSTAGSAGNQGQTSPE